MNAVEKIRKFFRGDSLFDRAHLLRLGKMPKEEACKVFLDTLYEQAVKRAGDFVNGELKRPDSPYRGISPSVFFEEVVAVTFWLIGKEVADGNNRDVLDELHARYFRSRPGQGASPGQGQNALMERYRQYDDTWNDVTGHFDEFGLCVVMNIFGKEESPRTRERTFWIIQYADEMARVFARCRSPWNALQFRSGDNKSESV